MQLLDLSKSLGVEIFYPSEELKRDYQISNLSSLSEACESDLIFLVSSSYLEQAKKSKAKVVLVGKIFSDLLKVQIVCKNPKLIAAKLSQAFANNKKINYGHSSLAHISSTASIDKNSKLYPFCYIAEDAKINHGCVIHPHAYIGERSILHDNVTVYPGAVIMDGVEVGANTIIHPGAVIGSDGFGFEPSQKKIEKFVHTGSVNIGTNVEVGALCTIDRATFSKTKVGDGCKLDSQVHIGHNVNLGENSMLCGQVGIAGSSNIGKRFVAAGQTAIGPGLEITDNVIVGPKSGVTKSLKEPGEYIGMPVLPANTWRRQVALLKKIPEMFKRLRVIENLLRKS